MFTRSIRGVFLFFAIAARAAAQDAPAPGKPPAGDAVVVRVLGQSIDEMQVLNAINQIAGQQRLTPAQMQQKDVLFFKDAVDNIVARILMIQEAKDMNVAADPAKAEELFKKARANFPSEEQFRKALEAQGMTEAQMHHSIEENLMLQEVVETTVKNVAAPNPEEITKFYNDNSKYFDQPERVRAAHILMRTTPESTPEQKAEARAKLETIRQEIEARKITFADAAMKHSQDPGSAQRGGDLGNFGRGAMVKPFEDEAFNTLPGTMSSIVETQFGFHLIQVAEHLPADKKTLEASSVDIRNFLERKAKQEKLQAHVQELRAKHPVETVMSQEEWAKRHGGK